MSSAALSTAGRFPVRRKRPNRPTVDNAPRLLASTERVPVHTQDWRGRPLPPRQVMANLIGNVRTDRGLRGKAAVEENAYTSEITVRDAELAGVASERDEFHGEWNYRIQPQRNVPRQQMFKLFLLASQTMPRMSTGYPDQGQYCDGGR